MREGRIKDKGAIAQMVEQRTENPCVPGSIPGGTTLMKRFGSIRLSVRTRDFHSLKSSSTLLWTTKYIGALSSAGSERLPYKQRVGGSNPSAPTKIKSIFF